MRRSLSIAILAAGLGLPRPAAAQTLDGSLAGRILDDAGNASPGALVAVAELGRTTRADAEGRFVLAPVPPGTWRVIVTWPDGRAREATGVTVIEDEATELVARPEEIRVTAADRRGRTTVRALDGHVLRDLPVDDVHQALLLLPGVVEPAENNAPALRGGGSTESGIRLDGVPLLTGWGRAFALGLGTNALEQVTVRSGPASAAYGDAQSGLISLVTRGGGRRLSGDLAYETDNLFGSGMSLGLNRFEGTVGGTVADRLAFFLGGTLAGRLAGTDAAGVDQTQAFVPGATDTVVTDSTGGVPQQVPIPRFVQYSGDCDARANAGASCHGRTLPYDWSTQVSLSGKLEWRYGAGSSVALTGLHHLAQDRFWAGRLAFNPATQMGSRSTGYAWILRWTQALPGRRGPTVQVALSRQSARVVSGPFDAEWAASHQEPTAGIVLSRSEFVVDFDRFSADTGAGAVTRLESDGDWDRLVNNVVTNVGTRVPYLDREDLRLAQPYRLNPWAAEAGFPTAGMDVEASLADQRHWLGRGVITWPWARGARLRVGAEHTRSRVHSFSAGLIRQSFMNVYSEDPIQTGVFAEQRYQSEGLLLSVGLRWDTFDPRTVFPVTPGRLFSNPNFNPADPYDSASGVYAPAESRSALSPRIRLAWTAPTGTTMRLGYAGWARHPDLTAMFTGKNRDLAFSSTTASFGGPLDWERSRHVEVGIRQSLGSRTALDAAGYLVWKVSDAALTVRAFPDPLEGRDIALVVPANVDTGTVKGLELTVLGQPAPWLDFQVGYTLSDARGTITAYQNRKHTLAGWLVARGPDRGTAGSWVGRAVSGAQAALRFRVSSGLPYFPLMNAGNGQTAPGGGLGDIAGQRRDTPGIKSLDLRIARAFRTAGVGWSVYADVRNLLDWRNEYRVFAETGGLENDVHRQRVKNPELERLMNDAGARWIQITSGGQTVYAADLTGDCNTWSDGAVNCVLLRRAEARWGNGDGFYDEREIDTALNAMYDLLYGPWTLLGPARNLRVGVEIRF